MRSFHFTKIESRQPWRNARASLCVALLIQAVASATAQERAAPEPAAAQQIEADTSIRDPHERWLDEVAPIILDHEAELFRTLEEGYQKDAFIREFWRVRDPYPQTGRNELRERYLERLAYAEGAFPSLDDARARILLVHGEPDRVLEVRCTTTRIPAVVWAYTSSDAVRFGFVLVFLRGKGGLGPARVWRPSRPGAIGSVIRAARSCHNGGVFDQVITQITEQGGEYEARLDRVLLKPRPPSLEWVEAFRADSADLPAGAETFSAVESVDFVGRVQSRTAVQWQLTVDPNDVALGELAGYRSFDFELIGEVVRDSDRLETFRYKFGVGEEQVAEAALLPLVFQRYLRPGSYRVVLRLEDLNGNRFFRSDQALSVPALSDVAPVTSVAAREESALFSEATEVLSSSDNSIRIMRPEGLQRGSVRFDTLAQGEAIRRVRFLLDDKHVATKTKPPFNVEVDLGDFPRERVLRVEALDANNTVLASDELDVNSGGQRFSVRLESPTGRDTAVRSVLGKARVAVPTDSTLDRVEYFVDERLAATLYQEPWTQPLRIADATRPSYVRVVAHLTDGRSAEDLVFVNGGDQIDDRLEVQVVEVYAAALDRDGRPLEGLSKNDFTIEEDGVRQEIQRFERVEDLPFRVGIVIDNSASMRDSLDTAKRAALSFLQRTVTDNDRAAVITFNRLPHLAVPLTQDTKVLGAGLAGLTPEGQTALYDSVMFSLYYFTGVAGQRAILLLSDGRDEVSRFGFNETLEYARRAGVTIYTVGLQIPESSYRSQLRALATETGGESYFIQRPEELEGIYERIERDLRSQYLLTYQSSNTSTEDEFRTITVRAKSANEVKAMSGYYP